MATISVSASVQAGDGAVGGRPAKTASTDGFKDTGYGLFCHWGSKSMNADGSKKDDYTAVTYRRDLGKNRHLTA